MDTEHLRARRIQVTPGTPRALLFEHYAQAIDRSRPEINSIDQTLVREELEKSRQAAWMGNWKEALGAAARASGILNDPLANEGIQYILDFIEAEIKAQASLGSLSANNIYTYSRAT